MSDILVAMCQNGLIKRRRHAKNTPGISARLRPCADHTRRRARGAHDGRFSHCSLRNPGLTRVAVPASSQLSSRSDTDARKANASVHVCNTLVPGPAWQVLHTYGTADASYGSFAAGGKPIVIASPDTPEERRRDQAARTAANTKARNRLCATNGSRQLENGAGGNPTR
jgi:hypothetical protein